MSVTASPFYITGGTVPPGTPSYVERQADRDLYESLLAGEFCYVLTSRQMGKSSLMVHTARRLRAAGLTVVSLDLTALGTNLSPEQWYGGLLDHLARQLALEEELEAFWLENGRLGPLQRWMTALREVALPRVGVGCSVLGVREGPARDPIPNTEHPTPSLVLFLDEIDVVRSLPFSTDEFFAAIRECYNRRSQAPEFERLTFCLLGVATPSDLIQDTRTTPFNIGRRIELTDFTEAEAAPLAAGLGRGEGGAGPLLARVLYWTGGHPYLTQRLCEAVAVDPNMAAAAGVDRQCDALFLSPQAREKDDNLLFVRERLLKGEVDRAALLDLYGQVRGGRRVALDDTNQLVSLLRLSGITRVESGRLQARNRIYERVFDQAWVVQHMPDAERRRQRAAYRRGLLRATATAAVIVGAVAGLALTAVKQARRVDRIARREAQQRRRGERLLYDADMQLAAYTWQSDASTSAVSDLLMAHVPQPGEPDLRGFEWRYLWNQVHNRATTFRLRASPIALAFAADGRLIAIDSENRLIHWDRARRRAARSVDLSEKGLTQIALSPDGRSVAVGRSDGTVKLRDAATGREKRVLTAHSGRIVALQYLADSKTLITEEANGSARVWDTTTGQERERIPTGGGRFIAGTVLSSDGRTLAVPVAAGGSNVGLFDWRKGDAKQGLSLSAGVGAIISMAFSPDGTLLATGILGGPLRFWNATTHQLLASRGGAHPTTIVRLAFSPDGKTLATGGEDGLVKLWDVAERRERRKLKGLTARIALLAFSRDGKTLAGASDDGSVRLWDGIDVASSGEARTLRQPGEGLGSLAYSPDGKLVATAASKGLPGRAIGAVGTARIWDLASGRVLRTLPRPAGIKIDDLEFSFVTRVVFSPDGRRLATGGSDSRVLLWDVKTGEKVCTLVGRPSNPPDFDQSVGSLAFSPDGKILAAGFGSPLDPWGGKQIIKLWEVASGREVHPPLKAHSSGIHSLAFAPDGKTLASASVDRTVKLWNVEKWKEIRTLTAPAGLQAVAFSPDGTTLAAGGSDGRIQLWDAATGHAEKLLKGHSNVVWGLAFSADGKTLVSTSMDRTVKLWDVVSGRETRTLTNHTGPVTCVAFSPDGNTLATGSGDGTLRLWEAASPGEIASWLGDAQARDRAAREKEAQAAARTALQVVANAGDRVLRLQWRPVPHAVGYYLYRGPAGATRAQLVRLAPVPVAVTSFTDPPAARVPGPNLINGRPQTYGIAAVFRGRDGGAVAGPLVMLQATPGEPPPGFVGSSINEGEQSGSVRFQPATGVISLRGSGHDIFDRADGCYFLNQPVTGDFRVTGKAISRPTATEEWAFAGLMLRESLNVGARHMSLATTARHGLELKWRAASDADTSYNNDLIPHAALELPILLRLTRRGSTITAAYSRDGGRSFQRAGQPLTFDPPLAPTVYAGLAITARDENQVSKAKFRDLRLEPLGR